MSVQRFAPFEVFACTLLKDLQVGLSKSEYLPAGTKVYGFLPPHGHVYLSDEGVVGTRKTGEVIHSSAQLGVDFDATQEVKDRLALGSGYAPDPNCRGLFRPRP